MKNFFQQKNELFNWFYNNQNFNIHKWLNYFEYYNKHFQKYKNYNTSILEIGVQYGGGAIMWRDYFGKNAKIIGIDINPAIKNLESQGMFIEIGDQNSPDFWHEFIKKYGPMDIIIDDGGHYMDQQITSFISLFPHIKTQGTFLCEDTTTSYWKNYGGGFKRDGTFIEFIKDLIDDIHLSSYKLFETRPFFVDYNPINFYTTNIDEIIISYAMVFITKEEKEENLYSLENFTDISMCDSIYISAISGEYYLSGRSIEPSIIINDT